MYIKSFHVKKAFKYSFVFIDHQNISFIQTVLELNRLLHLMFALIITSFSTYYCYCLYVII